MALLIAPIVGVSSLFVRPAEAQSHRASTNATGLRNRNVRSHTRWDRTVLEHPYTVEKLPNGETEEVGVPYCKIGRMQKMTADILIPSTTVTHDTDTPIDIDVHGGSWHSTPTLVDWPLTGLWTYQTQNLVDQGVTVMSIQYPDSTVNTFPVPEEYLECAMGYVQANAAVLGVNPNKMALSGDSAGGNIVDDVMVAPSKYRVKNYSQYPSPAAVLSISGVDNVPAFAALPSGEKGDATDEFGTSARMIKGSPAFNVPTLTVVEMAPEMIVVGTIDPITPPASQGNAMATAMATNGQNVTELRVRGATHDLYGASESVKQTVGREILNFLMRYLH
jgi:acetyl esterase/lipase